MPLFISDDELSRLSNDAAAVAERADAFIREMYGELETVKAKADATTITAEQTCSLLEQKFLSISVELSDLQSQNAQLQSSLDDRLAELAQSQAQKHQLHLQTIGKDGEIERLATEVSELHKSKRQLLEMIEQKDLEIADKNATIKTYLDKIVNLTDNAAHKEARLSETEAELVRVQATCTRLSQEKELIERHNAWLNEELTAKVDNLIEVRRTQAELEADMSAKLADVEKQYNECSSSLKWHKERTKELEIKLISLQEELCSAKEVAASNEERFSAELSIANKLIELHKESSEEWSKKAGELEGAIKALEMHHVQVEDDFKDRLEKEASAKKQVEKEMADLKEELEKCKAEIEAGRKANELNLLPLGNFRIETWINLYDVNDMAEDNRVIVPKIPAGVSGTALAASLLRDGWSLAKMYAKYQEAVDALRHEQLGRKESESILQRVLREIEEKAAVIMDERAEHERMLEAYSVINQKLQNFTSERSNLEKTIQELQADLRRHERDNSLAQKEITDLQKQVTVLLKECRNIQLRCGPLGHDFSGDDATVAAADMSVELNADKVISELTFKDINGLVEQNVQLRSLVRDLSDQIVRKEMEFKEKLELELKKQTDEAASKVAAVLQRAEEQGCMIESLHSSVAMYKKLYEEEQKRHLSYFPATEAAPDTGRRDLLLLLEGSQEASKKAQEKATERLRCLEEELAKTKVEIISLRSERDKFALEANFAREKLESVMKEAEHERNEINGVLARNVEFSQLIIDYQRKLRESSESLNAAEEHSRKLTMEVSVLKHEKELLANAEKRACDEVCSLSERVYRLQASLDTIQSAEEVREETRALERRRQEEYIKQIEQEWAEAKKQVQEERDNVRTLISDRERTRENAMKQVEEIGKELANALHACATAESRAAISEARLSDLEKKLKSSDAKILAIDGGTGPSSISTNEAAELPMAMEEIEKLKEELKANRDHMLQYKNIAQVNEAALRQMELAHENFKSEAEKLKKSLEAEVVSLRERVSELENESSLKSEEVASATAGKEEALSSAFAEITSLKEETSVKSSQIMALEIQISSVRENLEKEHEKWRAAQANYERQVILQSETIQELTKTSQELALLQGEASELRKVADALRSENAELKAKWDIERSVLEESRKEAEKKYDELNEQNKILHSRIEAMHIQLAEKDRGSSVTGSTVPNPHGDSSLQNVINYLRRTKEIAETEISLLKQEKLRLQSQLENALKAKDTVEATLNAERANSRVVLMTEDEIKSLQHQIREVSLLRESNMQLREENKHNFEECQKLREVAHKNRIESETLESRLIERQFELEAAKREIEMHRTERDVLEKRVSELLERCRNIDVDDYDRLKNDVQQKEEKLKEKDAQIDEITNLLSKKQDIISKLERDLVNSNLELSEKDKKLNDIMQLEANLKLEMEKQKKLVLQFKRRAESLAKEKEQMSKENQALSKMVEELKQGRRASSDITGDQVMKEKEEKDTRIQILEKTVERQREELKKEKDEHQNEKVKRIKCERTIMEAVRKTEKGKATVLSELEKYQLALKRISEELEKLKHAEGHLPQGTSVLQLLSGSISDDHASPYLSAAEDFERVARSILNELGTGSISGDVPSVDTSAPVVTGTAVPDQGPVIASSTVPLTSHHQPAKASEERKSILPKTNIETRKTGRKLVRPRFVKAEEPQGDVEMPEATSHDVDSQGTLTQQNQQSVRKRLASAAPELCEDLPVPGETSTDVAVPVLKKSKGADSAQEAAEGQVAAISENLGCPQVTEEAYDTVGDLTQGSNEEAVDVEKEEADTVEENFEESKEPQVDGTNEVELQENKNNMSDEIVDKPSGNEMVVDDESKNPAEQDSQQPMLETESEREEGELVPEVAAVDTEGGSDVHNVVGCSEIGDGQPELVSTPVASPSRVDDEALVTAAVEGDNSPDVVNDEKNDEVYGGEETVGEGFDKANDNEQSAVETDAMPEAAAASGANESGSTSAPAEGEVSKNMMGSSGSAAAAAAAEAEDVKQTSPISGSGSGSSTLVNLQERARERAMLRQAGVLGSSSSRGRGRAAMRARGARGRNGRGGRGGPSSEKQ